MQVMEQYIEMLGENDEWWNCKRINMTYSEARAKGIQLGHPDEQGGYYISFDRAGVHYVTAEALDEYNPKWIEILEQIPTSRIETSLLGVFNRDDFNFGLYAEILRFFQIEAQDRVNPGRGYDAWLIEMRENQLEEWRQQAQAQS